MISGSVLGDQLVDSVAQDPLAKAPRSLRDTSSFRARTAADVWAIVLAGGEGTRLRPLVRKVFGDDRPKQYAPLLGPQSLLGQTLDRIGLEIPVQRTIVVTMSRHAGYIAEEFARRPRPGLVVQPCDRGTVAAILYPAYRIAWEDPAATIALFPSDHLVVDRVAFMNHVGEIAAWVDDNPHRIVLLGAQPSAPEIEYGWIEPGDRLGEVSGSPVRAVREFWEKPSQDKADKCLAAGHLWNTSVLVTKVSALLALGESVLPDVAERLAQIRKFVGAPDERAAIHQAYQLMPKANFSRTLLESSPESLGVSRLPRVGWSDLGSPKRVLEAVTQLSLRPDWAKDPDGENEDLRALDPTPAQPNVSSVANVSERRSIRVRPSR